MPWAGQAVFSARVGRVGRVRPQSREGQGPRQEGAGTAEVCVSAADNGQCLGVSSKSSDMI